MDIPEETLTDKIIITPCRPRELGVILHNLMPLLKLWKTKPENGEKWYGSGYRNDSLAVYRVPATPRRDAFIQLVRNKDSITVTFCEYGKRENR